MRHRQEVLIRSTVGGTPIKVQKPRSVVREYYEMVVTLTILHAIMVCADAYHWVEDKRKKVKGT